MSDLALDDWLSEMLGKPAYRVRGRVQDLSTAHLPNGNSFIEARVGAEDAAGLSHLQGLGFRVVDSNLTLEGTVGKLSGNSVPQEVRFAYPTDESSVRALARDAFEQNRFHRDPEIPEPVASRIKEVWAANYFRGERGDWMVVVEEAHGVGGFLQLLRGADETLVIDLIAVARHRQGEGLARAMTVFASHACLDRPAVIRVGTQLGNTAAIGLYQSLGFHVHCAAYLLHMHR